MKKVPQIIFLLILSILMFIYSKDISENIISSIDIWKNNLFPSLFPFIVISKILINYGFISFISNIFAISSAENCLRVLLSTFWVAIALLLFIIV